MLDRPQPSAIERVAFHFDAAGDALEAARACLLAAGQTYARRRFDDTRRFLERALELASGDARPAFEELHFQASVLLARVDSSVGDYERSLARLSQLADRVRRGDDRSRLLEVLRIRANVASATDFVEDIYSAADEAIALAGELRDPAALSSAAFAGSLAAMKCGDTAGALDYAQRALRVAQEAGLEALASRAAASLSYIFCRRGSFDEAERLAALSLRYGRRHSGSLRAQAELAYAQVLTAVERYDEALAVVRSALSALEADGEETAADRPSQHFTLFALRLQLGAIQLARGDPEAQRIGRELRATSAYRVGDLRVGVIELLVDGPLPDGERAGLLRPLLADLDLAYGPDNESTVTRLRACVAAELAVPDAAARLESALDLCARLAPARVSDAAAQFRGLAIAARRAGLTDIALRAGALRERWRAPNVRAAGAVPFSPIDDR